MPFGVRKLRGLGRVGTGTLARPCRATLGLPLHRPMKQTLALDTYGGRAQNGAAISTLFVSGAR